MLTGVLIFTLFSCNKVDNNVGFSHILDQKTYDSLEIEYNSLIDRIEKNGLGYGLDVFDNEIKHRPMAYGLVLSAESIRHQFTGQVPALDNCKSVFHWLKQNSDLNSNGIIGYGLADEWDAFGDGTTNATNLEYAITTGIVINGLLDYYSIAAQDERLEIVNLVKQCFEPYLGNQYRGVDGFFNYSLSDNDGYYDVFNPAIYLAGQMMRFSTLIDDNTLKNKLVNNAASQVDMIQDYILKDSNDGYYWMYGTYIDVPNDLVHTLYIIEGLKNYKMYGGDLNSLIVNNSTLHLSSFYVDKWYEYIVPELQTTERNTRLWALGMLLYHLADEREVGLIVDLLPQFINYRTENGEFTLRENDSRVLIRQETHLLYGLSKLLYSNHLF
ncbi:MAG: hypothetical protein RIM99_03525 [Cyclobacteriaceae bacterium]